MYKFEVRFEMDSDQCTTDGVVTFDENGITQVDIKIFDVENDNTPAETLQLSGRTLRQILALATIFHDNQGKQDDVPDESVQ